MESIKEAAVKYEAPTTMNVADLEKFPIDVELKDGSGKDKDGVEFKYKYAVIDGQEYRVPGSVLGGIKAILVKLPDLKFVSVIKTGQNLNTRYQVVPITE